MSNALQPSQFLAMMQHHWREELQAISKLEPMWRCFDCKRWIPRSELPLRCNECSGPDLKGKKVGYRHKKIKQDAMVCKNCVDKHDHLQAMIFELQCQAYAHGLEKRAMLKTFGSDPSKYIVPQKKTKQEEERLIELAN
jgi:hypothetical protein